MMLSCGYPALSAFLTPGSCQSVIRGVGIEANIINDLDYIFTVHSLETG